MKNLGKMPLYHIFIHHEAKRHNFTGIFYLPCMGGTGKTLHFTQIYIIIPNDLYSGPWGINRQGDGEKKKSMLGRQTNTHLMLGLRAADLRIAEEWEFCAC